MHPVHVVELRVGVARTQSW